MDSRLRLFRAVPYIVVYALAVHRTVSAAEATRSETSHGVFVLQFKGRVKTVERQPRGQIPSGVVKNLTPAPSDVDKVRVAVTVTDVEEAHVYNSISLSFQDLRDYVGHDLVIDNVGDSATLHEEAILWFPKSSA